MNNKSEPVALPERKICYESFTPRAQGHVTGWNACLDEISKLGPLYPCADPGEVDRLRNCLRTEIEAGDSWKREAEDLRAQLADIDDFMDREDISPGYVIELRMSKAFTASTEPSAPVGIEQHKRVFVLGSAPGAKLPGHPEEFFVIAANGSISSFPDLVPDVLILNGYALVDVSGVGPETRANLRGRSVKKLIVIDNIQSRSKSVDQYIQEIGINFEEIQVWTKEQRAEICTDASGIPYKGISGNDIPSTGVTAICYALSFSGSAIVSGINVNSNGHSYSNGNFLRGHNDVDLATLSAIPDRLFRFKTREEFEASDRTCEPVRKDDGSYVDFYLQRSWEHHMDGKWSTLVRYDPRANLEHNK